MFEDYATGMGSAYDEMYDDGSGLRTPYSQLQPSLHEMGQSELQSRVEALQSSYLDQGVTFDIGGEERAFPLDVLPRVIEMDQWAKVEAGVQQRVHTLEKFLADVYDAGRVLDDGVVPRRVVTTSSHFHRAAAGHRAAQRRAGARQRHRPDPRRRRRVPGARGQRAGALRCLLRDDQPPGDRGGAARDLRRAPDPAGRRLPAEAAHRAARRRTGRCHRPQRRRADPRRLQRRLLRARAAGPHDGRRAGRGPRPRVPPRPRDDAYDAGPRAGARDLPPRRRRVPRPGALPQQLAARLLRPAQRRPRRQRDDRQRGRQRRRRRQADLHLPPRPRPLLPRRGADPEERRHLAARRRRPPRGGHGPPRRAGAQAGRRVGRQGHRDRAAGDARPSSTSCAPR